MNKIRLVKRKNSYWLLSLLGIMTCSTTENTTQLEDPDYSEIQWRTFYGEKPIDYLPVYWITYYGEKDNPNCQDPRKFYVTDGSVVIKKYIKSFWLKNLVMGRNILLSTPIISN
ncbi:hypothetical protein [Rodentibacter caecimuris]|uniref:Uncharacterized protein n=1 Tax=Rodentibacter caecimuris TaxID=1796644 RepID=A0ABX3KUR5_9PAST|nr:hypothetical protein BKG89_10620 [Rodentibacter heylii]